MRAGEGLYSLSTTALKTTDKLYHSLQHLGQHSAPKNHLAESSLTLTT